MNPEDEEDEDGAAMDLDANRKGKCAVIKTSTRQVRNIPSLGITKLNTQSCVKS